MSNTKQNGNIAFITGANRGLGLETARELGKQGITVVLGSRDAKKGEAASETPATKALPRKASALMSPKRRITNKLTITSPKSTAGSTFWSIMQAF